MQIDNVPKSAITIKGAMSATVTLIHYILLFVLLRPIALKIYYRIS